LIPRILCFNLDFLRGFTYREKRSFVSIIQEQFYLKCSKSR